MERKRNKSVAASLSYLNQGLIALIYCPLQLLYLGGIFFAQKKLCIVTLAPSSNGGWL